MGKNKMTITKTEANEANITPYFVEKVIDGQENTWCVDGRPDFTKAKGPQMPGASAFIGVLSALYKGVDFDKDHSIQTFEMLEDKGFRIGAHRGEHKHEGNSDCGFADKIPFILKTAVSKRQEITRRLNRFYKDNKQAIGEIPFDEIINEAYNALSLYKPEKIKLTGEPLIREAQNLGAMVENLEGSHGEKAAYVNLKRGVTFDTNEANRRGFQAFNMDLWSILDQAEAVGIDQNFALGASLILYQATEMVLVESKGKPPLPVLIH